MLWQMLICASLKNNLPSVPEEVTVARKTEEEEEEESDGEFYTDDEECSSVESELDEEQRKFQLFLQEKAKEQADFSVDFDEVLETLEDMLPPIPGKPVV